MNRMILANLVHRPFRTIISVVAVAVEVTLILLIVGIMLGMLNDSKTRQAGIGADIMVQPPGSSLLMHRSAIVRRGERRISLLCGRPFPGAVRHDH